MNGITLLLIGIAVLVCGYIFYGRWLCKQWGVGESTEATPAHTLRDDVDYVPAPAPVLMGHHFSSIAFRIFRASSLDIPISSKAFCNSKILASESSCLNCFCKYPPEKAKAVE